MILDANFVEERSAVDADFGEVFFGSGGQVELDTTLTKRGKAADAKAVGDALEGKQPAGKYLTEIPSGYATEEFVQEKIEEAQLSGKEVDLSGYALKTELPTKVSQLQNDAGYLTKHQDITGLATETYVQQYVGEVVEQVSSGVNAIVEQYVDAATAQPTSIDLSQYESNGRIVETFADGTVKTTTVEFNGDGKPVKITDSAGNTMNLTW